ncbi:MAG UNVERIFIED_CONTAM: hypothetical protein LVR18_16510 [Planctomycetaceae bacterium]|jgi:hypothetical protein
MIELPAVDLLPILNDPAAAPGIVAVQAGALAADEGSMTAALAAFQQSGGLVLVNLTITSALKWTVDAGR